MFNGFEVAHVGADFREYFHGCVDVDALDRCQVHPRQFVQRCAHVEAWRLRGARAAAYRVRVAMLVVKRQGDRD